MHRFLLTLVLVVAPQMMAGGVFVSDKDWKINASAIIDLWEKNRDNQKFEHEFLLYNAKVMMVWNEETENPTDRDKEIGLILIVYLNAKLYCQYVKDHPDELGDRLENARKMVEATSGLFRRYRIEIITDDYYAFKFAFGEYKELKLRSLDRL